MVSQLNGHEFEQILGDSEGQGRLVCCSPWGVRVRHKLVTEQLENLQHDLAKCDEFFLSPFPNSSSAVNQVEPNCM